MAVSPDAVVMPARPDRITIRVIAVITALLGVALATAQVSRAVWMLTSPEVTVNLLANGATPVASDAAVSASIDTVAVTTDLVASSRVLFAVGALRRLRVFRSIRARFGIILCIRVIVVIMCRLVSCCVFFF